MTQYTAEELTQAICAIDSVIHKCEKSQEKFPEGNAHHTLLRNRLRAMYIAKTLLTEALAKTPMRAVREADCNPEQLLGNLANLHTTQLGIARIKRNLRLDVADVVGWCRVKIQAPDSCITRKGKNWYVLADGCELTVNASSYTIITARLCGERGVEEETLP